MFIFLLIKITVKQKGSCCHIYSNYPHGFNLYYECLINILSDFYLKLVVHFATQNKKKLFDLFLGLRLKI